MSERIDAVVEHLVGEIRRQHKTVNTDASAGNHLIAKVPLSAVIKEHPEHNAPRKDQNAYNGIGDCQIAIEIDAAVCFVRNDIKQPYIEYTGRFFNKFFSSVELASDYDIRFAFADSIEFKDQFAVLHIVIRKLHNSVLVIADLNNRINLIC